MINVAPDVQSAMVTARQARAQATISAGIIHQWHWRNGGIFAFRNTFRQPEYLILVDGRAAHYARTMDDALAILNQH